MRDSVHVMEMACSVFARFDDLVAAPPNREGRRISLEKNSSRCQRNDSALNIEP